MTKATPHDQLASVITKALEEYAGEVTAGTKGSVKEVTKAGAKAVKQASKKAFGGTGEYAKSWTYKVETDRVGATGVIYSKQPRLPHLLENGHMLRNGRFWPGKPHIKPVEEQIVEDFEKEVMKGI